MIAAKNITKNYGRKPVLRGISFCAHPRQITLMVGPNGAGKSTTIKALAGLIRPDSGVACVNGFDIVDQRIDVQRSMAYLPQRPSFHPKLTCLEILRFYAGLRGVPVTRCEGMLQMTGLGEVAWVRTEKLSGGMRQLLGLAFLLLADAPVLLLDEPGLSLDPDWRKWLQQKLRFEAERGKTVLVTTHLIAEWNEVTDRCLLCRDGVIERELDPRNLPHDFNELGCGCDAFVAECEGGASPLGLSNGAASRGIWIAKQNRRCGESAADIFGDGGVAATQK